MMGITCPRIDRGQKEECTKEGVYNRRSGQQEEWTTGGGDNRRSGQQEWTTGRVDNRRSGQQEEWTTGGVANRWRIGTRIGVSQERKTKNNMTLV